MSKVRDWIAREPVRFRALIGCFVAGAAAAGFDVDPEVLISFLVVIGLVAETARAKVTPS